MKYAFDAPYYEVQFNARPNSDAPLLVAHRLRQPTLTELIERESQINLEIVETSKREEEISTDEEIANAKLWDKVILEVKGYKGFDDFRPLTETEKAAMRPSHKRVAVLGMYAGTASILNDDAELSIENDTWTIRHLIGTNPEHPAFTIDHILREPTELERVRYKRGASKIRLVRGSSKARTRIASDLKVFCELYDALVMNIDGATVKDRDLIASNRSEFLAAIDPVWKRLVVQTLMGSIEAALLD